MSHHISSARLVGYIHQTLDDAEREDIDHHLSVCAECRARLDDHEALQRRVTYGLMGDLRRARPSPRMSFASLAPRLKKGRRLAALWMVAREMSVVAAVIVIALLAPLIMTDSLRLDQLLDAGSGSGIAVTGGNLQRTGVYESEAPRRGELLWAFPAAGPIWTSPIVADETVYFSSTGGTFYALDSRSGEVKWQVELGEVFSSPAFADGIVYFGANDYLYALDGRTGEQRWRYQVIGVMTGSAPAVEDGTVYFGSGHYFYALDGQTGEEKWKFRTTFYGLSSSPAVLNGVVYFGGIDYTLYALDARTGSLKWQYETTSMITSSPAVSDDMVYFGSEGGYLYAVDRRTGELRWREMIQLSSTSPAVAEGVVYCVSYGSMVALDGQTGATIWRVGEGAEGQLMPMTVLRSSPAFADGVVYIGSFDHTFYALDAQTGDVVWKYKTGAAIDSSPFIADGIVYFGSKDGTLYAMR